MNNLPYPKDLRSLTKEQLESESNKSGLQFAEWNDLFNVESAMRTSGGQFSELHKWCILSGRFILTDRRREQEPLFTLTELKWFIERCFFDAFASGVGAEREGVTNFEACAKYLKEFNPLGTTQEPALWERSFDLCSIDRDKIKKDKLRLEEIISHLQKNKNPTKSTRRE